MDREMLKPKLHDLKTPRRCGVYRFHHRSRIMFQHVPVIGGHSPPHLISSADIVSGH